jgi:hypothetical protein
VFDLTNLKGEKRRNVGKLNNELSIVNQLVVLHFLLFVNITGDWIIRVKVNPIRLIFKVGNLDFVNSSPVSS